MLFTKSYYVMMGAMFVFGCLSSIRICVGYNYMIEMMPKSGQTASGTVWMIFEGAIPLFCAIYFWLVSTNWLGFYMCGYGMSAFALIGTFFLPESPRYMLETGKMSELRQALEQIARWNGKTFEWDQFDAGIQNLKD